MRAPNDQSLRRLPVNALSNQVMVRNCCTSVLVRDLWQSSPRHFLVSMEERCTLIDFICVRLGRAVTVISRIRNAASPGIESFNLWVLAGHFAQEKSLA